MFSMIDTRDIIIIILLIFIFYIIGFFIKFAVFKWKCNIFAKSLAEQIRFELEDVLEKNLKNTAHTTTRQNKAKQEDNEEDQYE